MPFLISKIMAKKYKVLKDIPGQEYKKGDEVEFKPFHARMYSRRGWIKEVEEKEEKKKASTKEEKTSKKTKGKK